VLGGGVGWALLVGDGGVERNECGKHVDGKSGREE